MRRGSSTRAVVVSMSLGTMTWKMYPKKNTGGGKGRLDGLGNHKISPVDEPGGKSAIESESVPPNSI